ncbi:IMP dehydrogenase [bacterium endosymbiont of Pedicinus badii]|uniref:IMP dehydrogenase n=1 Tax=bacterium endosymbiont of Pedicinus badii TaxID=1719126 RepID=UPI0009B99BD3|nr:IMP dehydrogenase [bacterium endosymbiont of Pedicinus badii]OQM34481.1 inosine-5'-monophosphate dehydrogenase [bacterium endosymbiont of Pedicinus badii]
MLRILKKSLTFDDVLLVPSYSNLCLKDINIKTKLTRKIDINIPIVSAAMDTVTESNLAIAIAKEGGIGFIHKNMSVEDQVKEILKVKRYKNGIIYQPKCVFPEDTIEKIVELTKKNGFSGYPVVSKNKKLVGIITKRDVKFAKDRNRKVFEVMTKKEKLITVYKNEKRNKILEKMQENKVEKILVINQDFCLIGMITAKDLKNFKEKQNSCKDQKGRLRVGAAISAEIETKRISFLISSGVDAILIDSSHAHTKKILKNIEDIKKKYPNLQIIAGNIATKSAAISLLNVGVDAVKVGIGPGSICTTRIITGVGIPQITAISDVAEALKGKNLPIIADGGIRYSGDIAKAIAAGSDCVMLGYLLAGTKESPGKLEFFQGKYFKSYRGMGSIGAISKGYSNRYSIKESREKRIIPEGIEGKVSYKGNLSEIIFQHVGGLKSSMMLTGCKNIQELKTKSEFIHVSSSGKRENHVHNVTITKEPPNYPIYKK